MFYEEKIINGRLYFRTVPNGEWMAVSIETLTERLIRSEAEAKITRNQALEDAAKACDRNAALCRETGVTQFAADECAGDIRAMKRY